MENKYLKTNEFPMYWYNGEIMEIVPREFIKNLKKRFTKNISIELSVLVDGTHTIGKEEILKCFDDALIDTLLEE